MTHASDFSVNFYSIHDLGFSWRRFVLWLHLWSIFQFRKFHFTSLNFGISSDRKLNTVIYWIPKPSYRNTKYNEKQKSIFESNCKTKSFITYYHISVCSHILSLHPLDPTVYFLSKRKTSGKFFPHNTLSETSLTDIWPPPDVVLNLILNSGSKLDLEKEIKLIFDGFKSSFQL